MKKLKKSLLVVPALGVLMLAAAGSVGGTVAWFSSVNTFETEVSTFAVGRVAGNLSVTMTPVTERGTIAAGSGVAIGKGAAGDVMMTHGSFNHEVNDLDTTKSVYVISGQSISIESATTAKFKNDAKIDREQFLYRSQQVEAVYKFTYRGSTWSLQIDDVASTRDGDDTLSTGNEGTLKSKWGITYTATPADNDQIVIKLDNSYVSDDDWMYSDSKINDGVSEKYWYYAVGWKMTFSYDFGSDKTNRNVYFDKESILTPTQREAAKNGAGELSYKGFRIAFHDYRAGANPEDDPIADRSVIWAYGHTEGERNQIHYVGDTDSNANSEPVVSNYTDSSAVSLLCGTAPSNVVVNTATSGGTAASNANRNYLLTLTQSTSSVTIDCVAWFEGSDPNVINNARLDDVTATLKFFAVAAA